jgi:hypothetical protein
MKYEYEILDSILLHNISLGNGGEELVPIPHQPFELLVSNSVTNAPDKITSDGPFQYLDLPGSQSTFPVNSYSQTKPFKRVSFHVSLLILSPLRSISGLM